MRLYCKDFDDIKCRYSDTREFCVFKTIENEYLISGFREIEAFTICGEKETRRMFVNRFEYLMRKTLKEDK